MEPKTISMLIVEDDPDYHFLLKELLSGEELIETLYRKEFAGTFEKAVEACVNNFFDVILLDLGLPDSQGLETVRRFIPVASDTPVIVLTGLNDEEMGLQAIHEGAQDYLVKGDISFPVLRKAINHAIERQKLLKEIKVLRGIIPICSYCKKIRDDKGSWEQMEMYIRDHSEAEFSHGICPVCYEIFLKDLEEQKRGRV
ncbi:MAG: response regulator [Deltaproteobacteria bacterium]|nr:response regulator [Deltaproteobacteria bacterium]